jgi:serine/threonine-protein kinase
MGEVWRARDPRLGRDVALKALPAAFALDPDRRARFEREARLLASLRHPNIATIYGLEDAGGAPHLVLELVEGESLGARLARGPLEPRAALAALVQVAAGIEAAHERGIVHRDLKPDNVMLESSGGVKVLDFGLAKDDAPVDAESGTMAAATMPGVVFGTLAYMSPEQARGQAVDRRSDVWSFGCVLFEALAGVPPFGGATPSDRIARILEREPDWKALPAGLSPKVRAVLERCLRKDEKDRPRDIRDVRLELAAVLDQGARGGREADPSIVVLPFVHAGSADDEYFADGITEEILNALAQVQGLRVAARTSSFSFKGRNEDLRRIAETLGVANVLEGSVRRAGNRLRITARLVDASDGSQMWSERYDRDLTDVFELQDEIAQAISSRLSIALGNEDKGANRGTSNVEAYDAFLKGRAVYYLRGRHVFEALAHFERAVALDPKYALAQACMADAWRNLATYGMMAPKEAMPRARGAAEKALSLDPDLAEAYATLADIEAQYDRDYGKAARSWKRALELDPRHVRGRCERALWSYAFGGFDLATAAAETALAVTHDPRNAWVVGMCGLLQAISGSADESLVTARRAVEIEPGNFLARINQIQGLVFSRRYDEAVALEQDQLRATGRQIWALAALAAANAGAGRLAAARALSDELEARARFEFVSPAWRAIAAASAGRIEEGVALFRQAVEERDPFVLLARRLPFWDPLRGHPGFEAQVASLGLLDAPALP